MKSFRSHGMMVTVEGASIRKGIIIAILSFMMIFLLSGIMTSLKPEYRISSSSINDIATHIPGESLIHLLGFENRYFTQSLPETSKSPNYTSALFKMATSINPDDPRSLLGRELPGYSFFDGEILVAGEGTDYTNMPHESAPPTEVLMAEREASIETLEETDKPLPEKPAVPPALSTGDKKVVHIYATHTRESYFPFLKGVDTKNANNANHSKANVSLVGEKLAQALESKGIGANVDKTDYYSKLIEKGWKYTKSYDMSRLSVVEAMASNRDIQYLIDIHRDSARKKGTTVTINGKSMARTAFIIGSNNVQYEKNFKIAEDLHHMLEKKYPGLSRGVFKQGGEGFNGKYNQDLSGNAMLIEFGGVDNNMDELTRTAEAIADVFSEYYWQAEKVNASPVAEKK